MLVWPNSNANGASKTRVRKETRGPLPSPTPSLGLCHPSRRYAALLRPSIGSTREPQLTTLQIEPTTPIDLCPNKRIVCWHEQETIALDC
jgi:hypothetical protein